MTTVYAEVQINEVALADIAAEEVSANAVDDGGEIDITVTLTGGTTVYRCARCNVEVNSDGDAEDSSQEQCTEHPNYGEDEENGEPKAAPHAPTIAPLGWVNHAGLKTDPEKDEVRFSISIDDPRGAFVITFARIESEDEETGRKYTEYRMAVPSPDDNFLHMPLTKINDGYYRVGERSYHD